MNKNDPVLDGLRALNLDTSEAKIYVELLKKPSTHAQISAATGINRTNVYRLIAELEKRGLVNRFTDDRGKFLVATDPSALEVELIAQEEQVRQQRASLSHLLPVLQNLKKEYSSDFSINIHKGTRGFRQMIWNELKSKKECLCIGYGTMEDLVLNRRWAERQRLMSMSAGYRTREITNYDRIPKNFTDNVDFYKRHYEKRIIPESALSINYITVIYNNTVATYYSDRETRVGIEIVSDTYAKTMRQIYDHFWELGSADK